ncbi:aldehyde dehydrogenase family protein [Streptomyces luomodiensis]|uniref:Aldehyde dehydrogenase family protein n=1 Tax=Streptomyces luomodiensis TaxID=3026192 RepID=A0ABY9UMZ4_9ACTN|nr:aldehyde dehydrogenase family protein [Streptomyces sp. SCA4-21]WNE93908.1 aldehyde dehydrogenase family protein [Streptomyces sp. SCA4-21]
MTEYRNFVGGRLLDGASLFDDINPVDGTVVARVHEADASVVDRAVRAARTAHDGPRGRRPGAERCRLMRATSLALPGPLLSGLGRLRRAGSAAPGRHGGRGTDHGGKRLPVPLDERPVGNVVRTAGFLDDRQRELVLSGNARRFLGTAVIAGGSPV